jgi:hypothetical protein
MNTTSDKLDIALRFINASAAPLFLTGKAGTGKTTFLKSLNGKTHKRFIVVAPTGIAALNAGGVTIHSQFLLPLGSFLPADTHGERNLHGNFYTRRSLITQHPLNAVRRQVLREIDLLVIDEVSMLRADILDAIDYRLRQVRGQAHKPFGGVQMLFIGDVYQLPPIARDEEWNVLSEYYKSPWFFESRVLSESGLVRIELDKVFRQEDADFIELLNHFRFNKVEHTDVALLNNRFMTSAERENLSDIITIVTHNYQADRINGRFMSNLPGSGVSLTAKVSGDFPENMYPLPEPLELKPDAQVMFVRNDTGGGRYYNGMLGRVEHIDREKGVKVLPIDGGDAFYVAPETWENKKYELDAKSGEMSEEVLGTYAQYPLKPAWAITVHKSQGLTFDRAILDVGEAFAAGQVYVALSRLRSLEGLVLARRISEAVIPAEQRVVAFSEETALQKPMDDLLTEQRDVYLRELLPQSFNFDDLLHQIERVKRRNDSIQQFEHEHLRMALSDVEKHIRDELPVTKKFAQQISLLLVEGKLEFLAERLQKARYYYAQKVWHWMREVQLHILDLERYSGTRQYRNDLQELDKQLLKQITAIDRVVPMFFYLTASGDYAEVDAGADARKMHRNRVIMEARSRLGELPEPTGRKSGKVRKKKKSDILNEIEDSVADKKKTVKGESHRLSCMMLSEGQSIKDVAAARGLAASTIEGHINKGIAEGIIAPEKVISDKERKTLSALLEGYETLDISAQFAALHGKVSYAKLRLMQILREFQKKEDVS